MQNLPPIGTILRSKENRDAIHIAIAQVIAAENLKPGDHVGLTKDGKASQALPALIGIVDPFLKEWVEVGESFFLFLYPKTVTSLRHEWTHPAFDPSDPTKVASEKWLRDFVDRSDCPDYDTVIHVALANQASDYLHFDGRDAHGEIPPEFWIHLEIVTGQRMLNRPEWFSCSC